MSRNKETGFTLIEVLVASAILMISIAVLMQLFSASFGQTQKAGQVAHLLIAEHVIVHELERVNPALQSKGEGVAEGLSYSWSAKLQQPFRKVPKLEGLMQREVALYRLTVNIIDLRKHKQQLTMDLLGWRTIQ